MVNFTGGTAIGARIMANCAERIAKCTLELGGKSAAVVADDVELDELLPALLPGMLTFQGQICVALSRVLVSNRRHDEVVAALVDAFRAQRIGDPQDAETEWGPLAVERARDRTESFTESALREGATLATGGRRPAGFDRGWYYEPTLLVDVDSSMSVAQDEIFGPIFTVIRYDTIDDAIRIANDTRFGLAGSVFTRDRDTALKVAHGVRSGSFVINGFGSCGIQPFGGVKQSGIGRECGVEGLLEFTDMKQTVLGDLGS
jgi:betaine-aldehyde dehydrogenase